MRIFIIPLFRASLLAQSVKNLLAVQEARGQFLGQEDLLEKGMATHSSILAWRVSWTEEPGRLQFMWWKDSDTTEPLTHTQPSPGGPVSKESACNVGDRDLIPGWGRSPGKGNGNLLSIAWEIPWTEKPGGLQSMESQRIGHELETKQQ